MRLAKGTSAWLAVTWIATVALVAAAVLVHPLVWIAAVPAIVLAILMLNFFRDPERVIADGIVSPADGVVHHVDEPEGPEGPIRVAVFMNPLNVHVNRAPLAARILRVEHVPGGFIPAFRKESERNERVEWAFETEIGEVRMVQIAGAVARRILPYVDAGAKVGKGERVGIIRLGSRVDTYLPRDLDVVVKVGDVVHAGSTTIARARSTSPPDLGEVSGSP